MRLVLAIVVSLSIGAGSFAATSVEALAQDKSSGDALKCPKCGHEFVPVKKSPPGMVAIPAGTFAMGCAKSDKLCKDSEKPVRDVYVGPYFMDITEVTVGDYWECVKAKGCTMPKTSDHNEYCNFDRADRRDHPVNCIEWRQAVNYCEWAGKRLPTEAEWERAARGVDGRIYPWGNETATCDYAVLGSKGEGCGRPGTWPVCSKEKGKSPYGMCDMVGNVWEWVADWYQPDYYEHAPKMNPAGPTKGKERVLRGASWTSKLPESPRATNRFFFKGDVGLGNFGFRCAASGK